MTRPTKGKPGVMTADVLVLDPTREFKPEQLSTFSNADNPLHNLSHVTVTIVRDDTAIDGACGPNALRYVDALNNFGTHHTHLVAELTPGVMTSPKCVMIPTVSMKGFKQAIDMWGVGQEAVGHAIAEVVKDKVIPKADADKYIVFVQVYIDPANFPAEEGKPNTALWEAIFKSVYDGVNNAWNGKQDVNWMLEKADKVFHPFGLGSSAAVKEAIAHAKGNAAECVVEG